MTTATADAEAEPAAREKLSTRLGDRYYALNPNYRVALRWLLILACTVVAFFPSIVSLVHTTTSGGVGGYVWTVPIVAALAAAAVARRKRNELPIHDRQTDMIVGIMGLVLALLVQYVLLQRFAMYFHLLRLDLVAMWLFVLSSCIVLFGLRPVSRFGWVWALLFMVFSLPYYLAVVVMGGSNFAAGAATLLISAVGVAIAVGRTPRRGAIGAAAALVVGFALLVMVSSVFPNAPLRICQGVPAVGAVCLVGVLMFVTARRGAPKRVFDRKVEPLAAKQVWSGVPLVVGVALVLALIPLPAQADTSVVQRAAPGRLTFGQPVVAPRGWNTVARQNFREVSRLYSHRAVLVRQQMTADSGDARFDKLGRPRTVMVDSIVSQRPFTFDVYPSRAVYDMTGARVSPQRQVDLGYGVTGQIISVVDDNLLITWNALRLAWGDDELAQRITIFAVDNHDFDAPFPQPSQSVSSTLRTLFTLLFRGNAVLDERSPTFKDAEMLTEFGRALVAAQFTPSGGSGMTIELTGRVLDMHCEEDRQYALNRAINRLRDDDPVASASKPILGWQRGVLWSLLVIVIVCAIWQPMGTAVVLIGLCTAGYLLTMFDRVLIFRQGLAASAIRITDDEAREIPDEDLPLYTILVPAYNEPEVVGDLIGAMAALEYPPEKLQVLLLLEEDDDVTINAAKDCEDSDAITILLVPPADPRTKPKACNYGLYFSTGDIVTIYDAEDLPESLQLRRVVTAFRSLPDTVACVQAKLAYHNGQQNILTGWFTAEYGLWFGYLLPGFMRTSSPIPLGGTSNHLRRDLLDGIGAWDPFNVTEDADLGLRIASTGYHTAVIDSTTLEEANSDGINWIRQRSRWYKGYLQSWLVQIRRPVRLLRTIGLRNFIRFNLVLAGTPIIAVLNLAFWLITMLWFLGQPQVVEEVFPMYIYFPALVALVLGNAATLYMNLIALREDDRSDLLLAALTVPVFWLMMSVAATKGVYQMIRQPSYWEKTFHGLATKPGEDEADSDASAVAPAAAT